MAIRFHLPDDAAERIAFAYSPLLELVLSLHVLVEPKHHPLQQPWIRQMRTLSPLLRRQIAAFGFVYRSYFPGYLLPDAVGTYPALDEELTRLARLSCHDIRTGSTLHLDAGAEPSAGAAGRALEQDARRQPRLFLEQFTAMMRQYWQEGFQAEWERLEPQLSDMVSLAGQVIATDGLYGFLGKFVGEVRIDRQAGVFWLARDHDHDVRIPEGRRLVLIPSHYVWPHVRINCEEPGPLALVFPMQALARATAPPLPPRELLTILKALGSDTRLRALQVIAERPHTTQELAPVLNLTEAAASVHLRALTRAGLLRRHRDGYYVLYELDPDRLQALTAALLSYLGSRTYPG